MSTASIVKSSSVHALIAGAFASVVGGAVNGLATALLALGVFAAVRLSLDA
ncbi:hypothetical protein [Gordonia aichiensis]